MDQPNEEQARSLNERAWRLRMQGALRDARELYLRSLGQWRALESKRGLAETLAKLGEIEMDLQHGEEARAYLQESADLWQSMGDWMNCAECLWRLGRMARADGRFADAERLQDQRWRYLELGRLQWEESYRRGDRRG